MISQPFSDGSPKLVALLVVEEKASAQRLFRGDHRQLIGRYFEQQLTLSP